MLFIRELTLCFLALFLENAASADNHSSSAELIDSSCFTFLLYQMIHQKKSFFSLEMKILYKARLYKKYLSFLSGLCVVMFRFSKKCHLLPLSFSFPSFFRHYIHCIDVTELNAKRAPCCAVVIHLLPIP